MIPSLSFRRRLALLTVATVALAAPLTGQALGMPAPPEGALDREMFEMQLPGRGISMQQVRQRFGEPSSRIPPVGDPPISRWVYDGFTVYFEHQYVIHSVLDRD